MENGAQKRGVDVQSRIFKKFHRLDKSFLWSEIYVLLNLMFRASSQKISQFYLDRKGWISASKIGTCAAILNVWNTLISILINKL